MEEEIDFTFCKQYIDIEFVITINGSSFYDEQSSLSLERVELRSDYSKLDLSGISKLYIYIHGAETSLRGILETDRFRKNWLASKFGFKEEDNDIIFGLRVEKEYEDEGKKRVFYSSGAERLRGWFPFEEEDFESIEESYRKKYNQSGELPQCITSYHKATNLVSKLADEIKDSKHLLYNHFYRSLDVGYIKGIFDRVDRRGPLFVLKDSYVTVIDNTTFEPITLEFKDWLPNRSMTDELINFSMRYREMYDVPMSVRWSENILINAERPLMDPLGNLIERGVLGNCRLIGKNNLVTHELRKYPRSDNNNGPNNDFLHEPFKPFSRLIVQGYGPYTFTFSDSMLSRTAGVTSERQQPLAIYSAGIQFDSVDEFKKISEDKDFKNQYLGYVMNFQFPELIHKISTVYRPGVDWEIRLDTYSSLFPPFDDIRKRLSELGVYTFKYSEKVFEDLNNLQYQPIEERKNTILAYLDYIGRRGNSIFREKFIDLKESIFSNRFHPRHGEWCPPIHSNADLSSHLENELAREFYDFYDKYKDEIDPVAREFYFGTNSKRAVGDTPDNYIIRKPWLESDDALNVFGDSKEIQIETKPLIQFVSAGLKLGMSITTILKALIGEDFIDQYEFENSSDALMRILPVKGKAAGNSPEIVNAIINRFIRMLRKLNTKENYKIVIK